MSKLSKEITNIVRDRRRDKGKTQYDLADALGVSRAKIAKIEAGNAVYSLDELSLLATYFSCTIKDLIPDDY
jgi:transcriptional regulator with XRE-family HTH domain